MGPEHSLYKLKRLAKRDELSLVHRLCSIREDSRFVTHYVRYVFVVYFFFVGLKNVCFIKLFPD